MRFQRVQAEVHTAFGTRTVEKFLWLPKTLQYETRWLETASIVQMWGQVGDYPGMWVDIKWEEEN